jgi:hypothetical protein
MEPLLRLWIGFALEFAPDSDSGTAIAALGADEDDRIVPTTVVG